ncbi:hypothetical protein PFDG_05072 [Plasmodium falciparum Dd2]|uniref:Uncharacterized protein n=1 Tax=Plasmodium falciparum (isolate Dd2) TaxID=57267 RepID=A0A0L7M9J5_PLAF4|nr:hypothetical protein PFDG_05072 [Plasmodium falciparum Dd2]
MDILSRTRFDTLPLSGIYLETPCRILNCVNLKFDINMESHYRCSTDGSIYISSTAKVEKCYYIFSKYAK